MTRIRKAQVGNNNARDVLPESYVQEPALLNTLNIIRAQARDSLCRMFQDSVSSPRI